MSDLVYERIHAMLSYINPPPPPPPPPHDAPLHLAILALTLALAAHMLLVRALKAKQPLRRPLLRLEPHPDLRARLAVVTNATSELGSHVLRLLSERGYRAVSADATALEHTGEPPALVVHLAHKSAAAAAETDAVLAACAAWSPAPTFVLVSDALVGCEPAADVTDGDVFIEPPPHSDARLAALHAAELAVHRFLDNPPAAGSPPRAAILRPHRIYGAASLPAGLVHFLCAGGGLLLGGARAIISATHVEHVALAVVRAAEPSAAVGGGPSSRVALVTDGMAWSASHLASCAASTLGAPAAARAPIFSLAYLLLRPLAALLAMAGAPSLSNLLSAAQTHQHFDAPPQDKVASLPGAPAAEAVHHALSCWSEAAGWAGRAVAPCQALSLALAAAHVARQRLHVAPDELVAPCAAALVLAFAAYSLVRALLPAPSKLPPQPTLLPPRVTGGLPILGDALGFVEGPVHLVTSLRSRYRSLFTTRVLTQRITFMIGEEAQRSFLKATDREFDQGPVYKFTVPVFGRGIVYDSPIDERTQQVKMLVHSMNTRSLEGMVPTMVNEAEAYFAEKWATEGEADLRETFAELIILTASACLMGAEVRSNLSSAIGRIYTDLDNGLTPFSVFFPRAPTKAHKARDKARAEMVNIFSGVIAERRAAAKLGNAPKDFLQTMIDFRYRDVTDKKTGKLLEKGRGYTDDEIVGLLVVLLFAGQHTSSITSTWLGAMLLSHRETAQEIDAERAEKFPRGTPLSYEGLLGLDSMRRAISETLRLFPPLIVLIRKAMVARNVGQYTIPKGDVVMICLPAGNKDKRYWQEPEAFKPSRFASGGDEEDLWNSRTVEHGANPGHMLSFGGGHHMCTGRRFGYLQVSSIWSILLRDFDLELISDIPKPNYKDMVVGPDGPVKVRYRRKPAAMPADAAA